MKRALIKIIVVPMLLLAAAKRALAGELSQVDLGIEYGEPMGLGPAEPPVSSLLRATVFVPLLFLAILSAVIAFVLRKKKKGTKAFLPFMIISLISFVLCAVAWLLAMQYGSWNINSWAFEIGIGYDDSVLWALPGISVAIYVVFAVFFAKLLWSSLKARRAKKAASNKGPQVPPPAPPPPAEM